MTANYRNKTQRKTPPYANRLAVPASNPTVFVGCGSYGWDRAKRLSGRSLVLPTGESPSTYIWPVSGCGVIVLDYLNMTEIEAQDLADELTAWEATCVIWSKQPSGPTVLIAGDCRV